MVRKCPPGILCIENYTLLFFVLLIIAILYFMNIKYNQNLNKTHNSHNSHNNNSHNTNNHNHSHNNSSELIPFLGNSHNTRENDVLLNPYSAPLRDDRILNNPSYNGPKIPINVPTQSCNSSYRQIGILTRINGPETISGIFTL
jgi:hypothetical protein